MLLDADAAFCAATLRQGSRSFNAAAMLLPPARRRHARALYGFCRVADDLIDDAAPADRLTVIAVLRRRLACACAGEPYDTPIDRAFAAALDECGIPAALPEALLEGFAWDAEGRRYADLSELRAYAARVAGTVGAMMALVLGVRAPAAIARACDLGVAMQLSNIVRDIGEDARASRLYLPTSWLAQAGIHPDQFLRDPTPSPALDQVIARLLDEAEALYAQGAGGIALLPRACRPAIRAAALLYREIGREVTRRGASALHRRAVVAPFRKARVLTASRLGRGDAHAPALSETAFLVHAVPRTLPDPTPREHPVVWVLELFARLEQRDQLRGMG